MYMKLLKCTLTHLLFTITIFFRNLLFYRIRQASFTLPLTHEYSPGPLKLSSLVIRPELASRSIHKAPPPPPSSFCYRLDRYRIQTRLLFNPESFSPALWYTSTPQVFENSVLLLSIDRHRTWTGLPDNPQSSSVLFRKENPQGTKGPGTLWWSTESSLQRDASLLGWFL